MKQITEREATKVQIVEQDYADGYRRARFLVTTVDAPNRNGRVYPKALAERETRMQFDGCVLGQSGHPLTDPDLLEQFIVWERAFLDGDKEYFDAKIVPTQRGNDFIELAKAGATISVSRRGYGSLKEEMRGGRKVKVVQDDYRLVGIDVLYADTQSDPNARMIHFEAKETIMDELTLEKLREEREDLVAEITKPLEEKVAGLETDLSVTNEKVATLETEKEQATVLAQAKETALAEASAKIEQLTTQLDELAKELKDANTTVTAIIEAANARKHLLEKVRGEKAAWLILQELFDTATIADVDACFDEAKRKNDALIEAAFPAGKVVYTANENADTENPTDAKPAETAYSKIVKNYVRAFGLAV